MAHRSKPGRLLQALLHLAKLGAGWNSQLALRVVVIRNDCGAAPPLASRKEMVSPSVLSPGGQERFSSKSCWRASCQNGLGGLLDRGARSPRGAVLGRCSRRPGCDMRSRKGRGL